jgi:NAD(P)H-hydrate epimerase
MKIIDVSQIRELDKFTIEHEPITSIDLMERAALRCVIWILQKYDERTRFTIICGQGNNGGDGLAIARLLADKNYSVQVLIIHHSEKYSADFTSNYERLKLNSKPNLSIQEIKNIEQLVDNFNIHQPNVLIDAIIGAGLNKTINGIIKDVIHFINSHYLPVISIDIPTGLFADMLNNPNDIILKATYTLSFQFPKLSFMFPENANYIGEFSILDIGLNNDYINHLPTKNFFIIKNDIRKFFKTRSKVAHKGNFGHALIIAGSYGKMGAAILSAKACMHSGAGLLSVHIPKCGYEILQTSLPEAMVNVDSENNFITDNIRLEKYNAIGIGPGIGTEKQTKNAIKLLIQNTTVPVVFDADALNIISENKTWLAFLPANSIFTPHLKEFERLAGKSENSVERLKLLREFSFKNRIYVVLKGAHSAIACPNGDMYFNSTGNPGMATGGSGDVLTGIITSFLAQSYTPKEACLLGVYLHGLAGDFALEKKSEESMISSDIIDGLSTGFNYLRII